VNIRALNLNLLPVLHSLLEERNVTRAARKLGMTQPAVSNSLAQLRAHFGDALLVRSGNTMVATERALSLREPLAAALLAVGAALESGTAFDPAKLERSFVIATTDYVGFVLMPKLLARIGKEAKGVRLHVQGWPHNRVPSTLERGEADLMLGFYSDVPSGHRHELLFEDRFVCIVRKGHPVAKQRLTLKRYLALEHVVVTQEPGALGVVDEVLAQRGLRRSIGLRLSHFLLVPSVVAATDFVAAVDERIAESFSKQLPLKLSPPPIPLPGGKVGQVWHERTHSSPAHVWLRSLVSEVAATL